MDLFSFVVDQSKMHPNFIRTLDSRSEGVRTVLSDWADGFEDRDGKFILEFQTTYNSSFWELYLFAVLKHLNIAVDFQYSSPDFVASDRLLSIEAVIAGHAQSQTPEWEKTIKDLTHAELGQAYVESIVRLSNAFLGKSGAYLEKYSSLPHMKERSYLIAISNFGTPDFHMLGDVAMQRLLYDTWEENEVHKPNGSAVPVGLFRSDEYSHVSGVFYSSVATFGKARALGNDAGDFTFHAFRIRDNVEPIQIVARKADYQESLTDGLRLFTNPFAVRPIEPDWFDDWGIRRFLAEKDGGLLVTCHPDGDLCMRTVHHRIDRSG